MKAKVVSIIGLFVLLAIGTVLVISTETKAAGPVSFEQAAQGYVIPMGTCTRFCSLCTPIGHGGACTTSGSCC